MDEPVGVGVDVTVKQLSRGLLRSLRDLSGGIRRGDRQVTARMLGTARDFMVSYNFVLDDMRIVHQFLANNVPPPTGGFAITLDGIRQQLLEHARSLRPLTPPPRRNRRPARRTRGSP